MTEVVRQLEECVSLARDEIEWKKEDSRNLTLSNERENAFSNPNF